MSHEIGADAPFMTPRDRFASFCFIPLATKYRGATGCPVRPIALV